MLRWALYEEKVAELDREKNEQYDFKVIPGNPVYVSRILHIVRLESMINVGCKFSPGDLTPSEWRDLIILAAEREWLRKRIEKAKVISEKKFDTGLTKVEEVGLVKARRDLGLPAFGQSIFDRR